MSRNGYYLEKRSRFSDGTLKRGEYLLYKFITLSVFQYKRDDGTRFIVNQIDKDSVLIRETIQPDECFGCEICEPERTDRLISGL